MTLTRRDFLGAGAAAAATAVVSGKAAAGLVEGVDRSLGEHAPRAARPVVVASSNGLRGVARAYEMLTRDGADTLDAAIAGVNIQELDPEDQSVGLGGLPNAEGVVQLDASCMHGPTKRAGAVAALEDIATPSLVAKAVMDYTDHIMLVAAGAKKFALEMGFQEQNLLTEESRQDWLRWRACLSSGDNWLDHTDPVVIKFHTGTINMIALNAAGDVSTVTTTSGLSWKIPGRVGDSPLIGAGQYCDNLVGGAGTTGRGEAVMKACASFLTVEHMRQGMAPEQACLKTLERIVAMTETRLLDERGRPRFDVDFYAVSKDGRFGSASIYSGSRFAVADATGARRVESAYLFPRAERPRTPRPACVKQAG
jgi:N4-(beta-N-acetylglucosaminyl)-L-asparaginase